MCQTYHSRQHSEIRSRPLAGNVLAGNALAGNGGQFCQQVLDALADCLLAAAAAATCQPGRVLSALGSCQLFAGAAIAPEPLPLVPLESLAGWVQRQQQAELSMEAVEDWRTLETLQVSPTCFVQLLHGYCAVLILDCSKQPMMVSDLVAVS
jgi:hypothetical protein